MHTVPDGVEVVATAADAETLALPPLLILDRLEQVLDEHSIGHGQIAWQRIGDGQSNITYLIARGDTEVVLRRGPRPPLPRSTHDMMREARVQQGLATVGVAVPRILAVCDDEGVLGVPFYIMEYLDGEIIIESVGAEFDTPQGRRAASESLVDTLIALHNVDLERAGLETFGRPAGYLERQIATFSSLATQIAKREMPGFDEVTEWLLANLPETQRHTLVHGDYRFGNVMLNRSERPNVIAVLDWEMATLGDPLADLGYLTATYSDAGSPGTVMEITTASRLSGFMTAQELAERYAEGTGLDISHLHWYQTLALWKSSVFLEAIYSRWKNGERPDDDFVRSLETGIPHLIECARTISQGVRVS